MKKHMLLLAILPFLFGCSLLKLPGLPTPKGPQTVYNWSETITKKPRIIKLDNGQVAIVTDETKELVVGYEKVTPKRTFVQKIGAWVSGLGVLGFVLLAAGLVLAPGMTIGFLFKTLGKWKRAMRETVSAIKESKIVEQKNGLSTALSEKQSSRTKLLVDSIKRTT